MNFWVLFTTIIIKLLLLLSCSDNAIVMHMPANQLHSTKSYQVHQVFFQSLQWRFKEKHFKHSNTGNSIWPELVCINHLTVSFSNHMSRVISLQQNRTWVVIIKFPTITFSKMKEQFSSLLKLWTINSCQL